MSSVQKAWAVETRQLDSNGVQYSLFTEW
jgi:hypothetical protein